ncbi:MAG: hypothetical protein LBN19_03045 [Endomicrobium sp.]|nr:hypothetical protein [Endomicrobium sp.]
MNNISLLKCLEELFNKVKATADASTDKSFGGVVKASIAIVNEQAEADGKRIFVPVKKILGINSH